ncbi:hypothetical protein CIPAW_14G041900 [Carya illinoinensis]|uniref:Uncharacterized protein n=1 Tax=Carya illinoinensis TaxID=32201 RepID=A0A8T1NGB1_CARIL|nr:hypothetical protein CIPAW_14G041900 [Carya illinoinensis]
MFNFCTSWRGFLVASAEWSTCKGFLVASSMCTLVICVFDHELHEEI